MIFNRRNLIKAAIGAGLARTGISSAASATPAETIDTNRAQEELERNRRWLQEHYSMPSNKPLVVKDNYAWIRRLREGENFREAMPNLALFDAVLRVEYVDLYQNDPSDQLFWVVLSGSVTGKTTDRYNRDAFLHLPLDATDQNLLKCVETIVPKLVDGIYETHYQRERASPYSRSYLFGPTGLVELDRVKEFFRALKS